MVVTESPSNMYYLVFLYPLLFIISEASCLVNASGKLLQEMKAACIANKILFRFTPTHLVFVLGGFIFKYRG